VESQVLSDAVENRVDLVANAMAEQARLSLDVEETDRLGELRRIAGADVAYEKDGERFFAAVVVLDAHSLEVVEIARHEGRHPFPYVPGLLSFRELPALLPCFEKLSSPVDLIVCDGNGRLHPRGFGIACHLGVALDVPTIGCAKNLLLGDVGSLPHERGAHAPIVVDGIERGSALRTRDGVKPVFVSIGHRVSLPTARALVLRLARDYRLPETTRAADHEVNLWRRAAGSSDSDHE
jgi:deoxyribonuclease V